MVEHGNAVSVGPARNRADLTARRVRGHSMGMTEKAKASGKALDRPTSVGSEMARRPVEPLLSGKANDDRRPSVDAPGSCGPKEHSIERLRACIAKLSELALSSVEQRGGQLHGGPYEDLSRMRENLHVRFLVPYGRNAAQRAQHL